MRFAVAGTLSVAAVCFAGCASAPAPSDHFYRIEVDRPAPSEATEGVLPGSLEVDRFIADGVTAERAIVYTDLGKIELQRHRYHYWATAPTHMLQEQLLEYLQASRVARSVVVPEMRARAQYLVTGRINQFERILEGADSRVLVELRLGVKEVDNDRILMLETYRVEMASGGDSVADAVSAFNEAVAQVFARFVEDLARARR